MGVPAKSLSNLASKPCNVTIPYNLALLAIERYFARAFPVISGLY